MPWPRAARPKSVSAPNLTVRAAAPHPPHAIPPQADTLAFNVFDLARRTTQPLLAITMHVLKEDGLMVSVRGLAATSAARAACARRAYRTVPCREACLHTSNACAGGCACLEEAGRLAWSAGRVKAQHAASPPQPPATPCSGPSAASLSLQSKRSEPPARDSRRPSVTISPFATHPTPPSPSATPPKNPQELLGPKGEEVLARLIAALEAAYNAANPYHNAAHAADVVQAAVLLLCEAQARMVAGGSTGMTALERLSAILAAAAHDVNHQGVTSAFLVNAGDALAEKYGSG